MVKHNLRSGGGDKWYLTRYNIEEVIDGQIAYQPIQKVKLIGFAQLAATNILANMASFIVWRALWDNANVKFLTRHGRDCGIECIKIS